MANEKVAKFGEALQSLIALAPEYLAEFPHLELMATSNLKRVASQIAFVGTGEILNTHTPMKLEPITDFMGEPIEKAEPITVRDLSPQELELKMFREKVTRLRDNLPTLSNEQVLEAYQVEPNVIRGVAKHAGMTDYKTATINSDFVENIRKAIVVQEQEQQKEKNDADIVKSATSPTADVPATNNAAAEDTVPDDGGDLAQ